MYCLPEVTPWQHETAWLLSSIPITQASTHHWVDIPHKPNRLTCYVSMAPGNCRTEILISIHTPHVENIVAQEKYHEFRKYLIPTTVKRIWIYETSPTSSIKYCADIKPGKGPGELAEDDLDGQKNRAFNNEYTLMPAGSGFRYAYKISGLYRLGTVVSLRSLVEKGWARGPPQKYIYASPEMMKDLVPNLIKIYGGCPESSEILSSRTEEVPE